MNQMVSNLYVKPPATQSNKGAEEVNDEQQTSKRKQSNEKSTKLLKKKKTSESVPTNDIEGSHFNQNKSRSF